VNHRFLKGLAIACLMVCIGGIARTGAAADVLVSVDCSKVVNTMRVGFGASWHVMETPIPYGVKHPVFTGHSHGGSGWGGDVHRAVYDCLIRGHLSGSSIRIDARSTGFSKLKFNVDEVVPLGVTDGFQGTRACPIRMASKPMGKRQTNRPFLIPVRIPAPSRLLLRSADAGGFPRARSVA
jgi:hypothetical protein